ncbi:YveK family protein [Clostridium oceanicum]|uniref:Wzz/FepE/Etk N-terminal domain-containing protein n=1 Tax=Clostridium oceanicum TaxID=1543 RepID=A0ABP3V1C4_9CLOT
MEEEITLDLRDVFEIIKKRLGMILIITLSMGIIAAALSFFVLPPTYEAKASIVVGKQIGEKDKDNNNYNDVMMYQKLVKTYAKIAESRTVAQTVSSKVGNIKVEKMQKKIKVTPQADTQILDITVTDKDPNEAYKILNTVCAEFIAHSKKIYPSGGSLELLDKPIVPDKPIKPKKTLNIAIALFLGLFISTGVAFLLEYMDKTIKTEEDIQKYLDLPVIAVIPKTE